MSSIEWSMNNCIISGGQTNMCNSIEKPTCFSLPISGKKQLQNLLINDDLFYDNFYPNFEYTSDFIEWLSLVKHSIVISFYKSGYIFSIGTVQYNQETKLSLYITQFERPMGLCIKDTQLIIGSSAHIWKYYDQGLLKDSSQYSSYTNNYFPRQIIATNSVDIHDICIDHIDEIYFCSAKFNCVCTTSKTKSFKIYWTPPWISKIEPFDKCHLNGLCCRDGVPRYISSISRDDVPGLWRQHRTDGGILWDIIENKLMCENLAMPHSPRWHHNKLWVLESGRGYFGYIENNTFVPKVFIPGFLRGLSFINDTYAMVGSSLDRHEKIFHDLPLGQELLRRNLTAVCGVFIIDLVTFQIIHQIQFHKPLIEAYDVISIAGVSRLRIDVINAINSHNEFFVEESNDQTKSPLTECKEVTTE